MTEPMDLLNSGDPPGRDVSCRAAGRGRGTAMRAFRTACRIDLRRLIDSRDMLAAPVARLAHTVDAASGCAPRDAGSARRARQNAGATIWEMDSMIAETLAFARDEASAEPRRRASTSPHYSQARRRYGGHAGLLVDMSPSAAVPHEYQPERVETRNCESARQCG